MKKMEGDKIRAETNRAAGEANDENRGREAP